MQTINEYLNTAKKVTGSDYQTAKKIGVSRQAISTMRARETMSNENAAKLAELIKEDFRDIIAACEIGKHPNKRPFWTQLVAVVAIMSVCNMSQNSTLTGSYNHFSVSQFIYYTHK